MVSSGLIQLVSLVQNLTPSRLFYAGCVVTARVVTARVHVVLGGSLRPHREGNGINVIILVTRDTQSPLLKARFLHQTCHAWPGS